MIRGTSARGIVAVVLAVGAAVSVLALSVGAVLQHKEVTPQGAALLTTALGTLIGAVATYLGGHYLDRNPDRDHDQEDPDENRP